MSPPRFRPTAPILAVSVVLAIAAGTAGCGDESGDPGRDPAAGAGAGAGGADTAGLATDSTPLARARHRLRLRFHAVQQQLRPIQIAALDSPGVREAQERFEEVLRERMVEIDPRAADWIRRAERVGRELRAATTSDTFTLEEQQRIATELQEVSRLLDPVQTEALGDSSVSARFVALQDSLVATMVRIRPVADTLVERMRAISDSIAELERRARAGGNGAGRRPATPPG